MNNFTAITMRKQSQTQSSVHRRMQIRNNSHAEQCGPMQSYNCLLTCLIFEKI